MPASPAAADLSEDLQKDLDLPEYEVEDDEKGGALVKIPSREAPASDTGFYDNLVADLDSNFLAGIGLDLSQKVANDIQNRKKRDDLYAEGLKRTGLGNEAPGGAKFEGASRVVHPMLINASVEFQSRAVKELLPPGTAVKSLVLGTNTKARSKKAERKSRYFNWQLTVQMTEFKPELEKTLAQCSLSGAHYLRLVWDERFKRPVTGSASTDKVVLNYGASSFETAERITYFDDITEMEFEERVQTGMYFDMNLVSIAKMPDATKPEDAKDKIAGVERPAYNDDGLRRIYEINTYLKGVESALSGEEDNTWMPYIVHLDESTNQVLSIIRNWEKDDDRRERMHWLIEFPFVPWDGAYPIGFMQMIGGLSGAATGALRALLDSAHANNFPGALVLKGSNTGGQSKTVNPGEMVNVDGGVGADDIRKVAMPIQPGQPSATLFNLLGFLVEAGQGTVRTTFENFQDSNNPQMPVGTIMALIEQGLAVVSTIIGRMHTSMQMVLKVLHRINRMYVTDNQIKSDTGEVLAYRSDFEGPLDVVPITDPSAPSDAHRFAQVQTVAQRATLLPQVYDVRAVEMRVLRAMKITDPDSLLLPKPEAKEMNAVNENVAASLGRPITAFPMQDHLAHLQAHLDFMKSPVLGANPLIAPRLYPIMAQHLSEHFVMYYVSRTFDEISDALQGRELSEVMVDDPEVRAEMDRLIAQSSPMIMQEAEKVLAGTMQIINQAAQYVNARQMPPPMDPNAVLAQRNQIDAKKNEADAALKGQQMQLHAQRDAQKLQLDAQKVALSGQKMQLDAQTSAQNAAQDAQKESERLAAQDKLEERKQQAEMARSAAEIESEQRLASLAEAGDDRRAELKSRTDMQINTQDNMTAMQIAEAEIESGERVAVKNGKGINPG